MSHVPPVPASERPTLTSWQLDVEPSGSNSTLINKTVCVQRLISANKQLPREGGGGEGTQVY